MAKLRVISLFTSLASVLTSALVAFRTRRASPPVEKLYPTDLRGIERSGREGEAKLESPTWPPQDGVYWGM